jgi:hypothetical protein
MAGAWSKLSIPCTYRPLQLNSSSRSVPNDQTRTGDIFKLFEMLIMVRS